LEGSNGNYTACNQNFGNSIDAELAKAFGYVGTHLRLSRERGSNPPVEVKEVGTDLQLLFDGKHLSRKDPIVKIKKEGTNIDIDVTARSSKELDRMMRSLKGKYNLPLNSGRRFQEKRETPVDTNFSRVLDSTPIRRAVTKIAYSLLCDRVPAGEIFGPAFDQIRAYIRGYADNDMASANYTTATTWTCDFVRPLHKVHIGLNRRSGVVVGFVTIFGMFRFTVLLSKTYNGILDWPSIHYTYDPAAQRIVEGNPNFLCPVLTEAQILRPKQSIALVRQELMRSNKMLETYVKNYMFLDIEFVKPVNDVAQF
jgi:hypothetical protein